MSPHSTCFCVFKWKAGICVHPKGCQQAPLGNGQTFQEWEGSFRKNKPSIEIAILDALTSTGSYKGSGRALPFLLPKISGLFRFLTERKLFQEGWHETVCPGQSVVSHEGGERQDEVWKNINITNAFKNIPFGQLSVAAQLLIIILFFFNSPQSVFRNISSISWVNTWEIKPLRLGFPLVYRPAAGRAWSDEGRETNLYHLKTLT